MKPDFDCVVIGGGPAGASCARGLTAEGARTLVVERARLPRHKACSGILLDRAVDFVRAHFGELPDEVFCEPRGIKGMSWNFPRGGRFLLTGKKMAANIRRREFDAWLLRTSGAEILDGWRYVGHREKGAVIECRLRRGGTERTLTTRYLVGADGARSAVRGGLDPDYRNSHVWISAYQVYVRGRIDLDPEYMHLFFDQALGTFNPGVNIKGEHILICSGAFRGGKPSAGQYLERLIAFLEKEHGLNIDERVRTEAALFNLMTPTRGFFLGRGRVLLTGEAAGFLHGFAEGLSCALRTGKLAAEAVATHLGNPGGASLCSLYNGLTAWEGDHALDTWNPFRFLKDTELTVSVGAVMRQLRPNHLLIPLDVLTYTRPFREQVVRPFLKTARRRLVTGRYVVPAVGLEAQAERN